MPGQEIIRVLMIEDKPDDAAILRRLLGKAEGSDFELEHADRLSKAEDIMRDTDFAEETANLTRAQILQQAGTSQLAIANNTAQSVLALLQG